MSSTFSLPLISIGATSCRHGGSAFLASLLLTLFLNLASSTEALASCGDYLLHSGAMNILDEFGNEPSPQEGFGNHHERRTPCDGPGCRPAPSAPPATPPAPVEWLPPEAALGLSHLLFVPSSLECWWNPGNRLLASAGFPHDLLRPPAR